MHFHALVELHDVVDLRRSQSHPVLLTKNTVIEAVQQVELWRIKHLQQRWIEMNNDVLVTLFLRLKIRPMQFIAMHDQQVAVLQGIHLFFNKIMNISGKEKIDFILVLMLVKIQRKRIMGYSMSKIDQLIEILVHFLHVKLSSVSWSQY